MRSNFRFVGLFVIRVVLLVCAVLCFAPNVQAQTPNWSITLNAPEQTDYPGATLTYSGTITNSTGAGLSLLGFALDPPDGIDTPDYTLHYTDAFNTALANNGFTLPAAGYTGTLFTVTLKPGAPVSTTFSGTFELSVDAPGYPITLVKSFSARTIAPSNALLSGTLLFDGLLASTDNQTVTFLLHPADNSGDLTYYFGVPPTGEFQITDFPKNNYTLHVKGDKYLAANLSVDATIGKVSGLTVIQRAGDATNDNSVDIGDFGVLVNAYNSDANSDGSGYDETADFNGDGVVDIADFGILVNNYNQQGAP